MSSVVAIYLDVYAYCSNVHVTGSSTPPGAFYRFLRFETRPEETKCKRNRTSQNPHDTPAALRTLTLTHSTLIFAQSLHLPRTEHTRRLQTKKRKRKRKKTRPHGALTRKQVRGAEPRANNYKDILKTMARRLHGRKLRGPRVWPDTFPQHFCQGI